MALNVELDLQLAADNSEGLPVEAEVAAWVQASLEGRFEEAVAVTIRIVDEVEGRALNESFRHKQGPTNVLSFPYDGEVALSPVLLGDIVICAPVVATEAREQAKLEKSHWCHMVVHGMLHLLGYDHINDVDAEEMESEEIVVLSLLGYANPYVE